MKEKINSFIDMYEELLILAKIQAKSHACKEGEFEEDSFFTTRLAIKRFVFEIV